jgi:hypothetical protein
MEIVHPRVAGLDVHKKQVTVAVLLPGASPGDRTVQVRQFRTFWRTLQQMAAWLVELGVWRPIERDWAYVGDDATNVFPIALNDDGVVLGQGRNVHAHPVAVICVPGGKWERLGTDDGWIPVDINNRGDVIGRAMIDRIDRPWLRGTTGQIVMLPYITNHHAMPIAINNAGQIIGRVAADHGSHATIWDI